MAQPTEYDRQYSFTNFSTTNPSDPQPGDKLDAEFNAVKLSLDDTQANLALIQDDDGALARGAVGRAQLDSSITIGFSAPEPWASDTLYDADTSTVFFEQRFYICTTTHTSGADFEPENWAEIADFSLAATLDDGSVEAAKLAVDSVTTSKIENLAVTEAKIADGAVVTAKLADDAVTTAKIADANITTALIADENVTTTKIADENVTTAKIADVNITTAKLANTAVTAAKIGTSAVETSKIADNAVTLAKLEHGTQGDVLYYGASGSPARLATGSAGRVLTAGGAGANPSWQGAYLHLQMSLGDGVANADAVGSAWNKVPLNTERVDEIGVTLSSSQFVLPAGTYEWRGSNPYSTGTDSARAAVLRMYNVTDSAELSRGPTMRQTASQSTVFGQGRFTLTATKTVRMEMFCSSAATAGLGAASTMGFAEVYGDLLIRKVG